MAAKEIKEISEAESLLEQIESTEAELREAEGTVKSYKEALDAAKETRDELLKKLRGLAAARSEDHPLLEG